MIKKKRSSIQIDELFAINFNSFKRDFLPVYKRYFMPKYLIQFPILLPFRIPFKNGTCVTLVMDGDNACTYHFSSVTTSHNISVGIVTPDPLEVPITETRVEMMFATGKKVTVKGNTSFSGYFDELLSGLNLILSAYLIQTKDVDIHRVSKEMLQFGSMYKIVPVQKWDKFVHGLFLLHPDVPYERKVLNKEVTEKVIWYANVLNQQWNPFMLSEELALSARRYLKHGFYRDSVLCAQMSVETFLNTLFTQLLLLEGKSLAEAELIREGMAFMSMVKREFHPRLGGKWNIEDMTTELGKWNKCTYEARNKVAHTGFNPCYDEARIAIGATEHLRLYVVSLVESKAKKYPDIVKYFVVDSK